MRNHSSGHNGSGEKAIMVEPEVIQCPLGLDGTVVSDIEHIKERQDEGFRVLNDKVDKLTTVIMNPETGLYSRLLMVEKTKNTLNKIGYGALLALISAAVVSLAKLIF